MPLTLKASSGNACTSRRARAGIASSSAPRQHQRLGRNCKTAFSGASLGYVPDNGSMRWSMAQWLENKASIEVPAPLDTCWPLWEDRERIPTWMPWIKSVKVLDTDPRLSRWTLATNQFGRDWEFSWLARNLPPVKGRKIHWVSERGSASLGLEISNRGQIKFAPTGPSSCAITLIISYEVPDVLVPFASALTPLVEGIIGKDMERFRDFVVAQQQQQAATAQAVAVKD